VSPILVLALRLAAALAGEAGDDATAAALRDRVVEEAPLHRERARRYRYRETVTVYEHRRDQEWVPRPAKTYQVFPIESYVYRRLLMIGGVPLSERQERKETSREAEFRRQVENDRKVENSRWRKMIPLEKFVDNYEYRILGTESIEGRPATVLEFRPGEWKHDLLGHLDRIFSNLEGRVWVDEEDYQVVRVEARLRTRIRWGLGLVATLHTFELEVNQRQVDEGVWLPDNLSYQAEGSAFILGRFRKRIVTRYHDFERIDPVLPETVSSGRPGPAARAD
jgi:hypothetical protein